MNVFTCPCYWVLCNFKKNVQLFCLLFQQQQNKHSHVLVTFLIAYKGFPLIKNKKLRRIAKDFKRDRDQFYNLQEKTITRYGVCKNRIINNMPYIPSFTTDNLNSWNRVSPWWDSLFDNKYLCVCVWFFLKKWRVWISSHHLTSPGTVLSISWHESKEMSESAGHALYRWMD